MITCCTNQQKASYKLNLLGNLLPLRRRAVKVSSRLGAVRLQLLVELVSVLLHSFLRPASLKLHPAKARHALCLQTTSGRRLCGLEWQFLAGLVLVLPRYQRARMCERDPARMPSLAVGRNVLPAEIAVEKLIPQFRGVGLCRAPVAHRHKAHGCHTLGDLLRLCGLHGHREVNLFAVLGKLKGYGVCLLIENQEIFRLRLSRGHVQNAHCLVVCQAVLQACN
mmetsp:Transcript_97548/g.176232  ORF Transcript_97548/g.176232 Transcript_97548/m.176232 type:complete len:223 (-) Transcript_97548:1427-2095(-)